MDRVRLRLTGLFLLLCALPGCAVVDVGVRNPVPGLETVAVAPFFNLSQERTVDGREFALAYYSELQKVPGFEVLPVGVAERAMIDHGLTMENPDDALELARILGVDAVVIGAVTDYDPYSPRVGLKVAWYSPQQWLFLPNSPPDKLKLTAQTEIPVATVLRAQSPPPASESANAVPAVEEGDWESMDLKASHTPIAAIPDDAEFLPPRRVNPFNAALLEAHRQPSSSEMQPEDRLVPDPRPLTASDWDVSTGQTPEWTNTSTPSPRSPLRISQLPADANSAPAAPPAPNVPPAAPQTTTPPATSTAAPAGPARSPMPIFPPAGETASGAFPGSRTPETPPTLLFGPPDDAATEDTSSVISERTIPALVFDDHVVLGSEDFNPREPLMAYVRMFDSTDSRLVARLADYLELSGETRSGDLEAYMKRSDFFRKFTAHVMISEMLMLHGGESRRRFVLKQRRYK